MGKELKQKSVHEHTARERDEESRPSCARKPCLRCGPTRVGDGDHSRARACWWKCRPRFLQKRLNKSIWSEHGRRPDGHLVNGEAGYIAGGRHFHCWKARARRRPQPDGGFAPVGLSCRRCHQNCCRGIKETPHAAGTRAVDAALNHGGRHAARLLKLSAVQKPSGTWVLEQAELTGAGQRRCVERRVRTPCHRVGPRQMRCALKVSKASDKKLAAPYGAIGAGTESKAMPRGRASGASWPVGR